MPGVIRELVQEAGVAEVRQRLRASENDKVSETVERALQGIEPYASVVQHG